MSLLDLQSRSEREEVRLYLWWLPSVNVLQHWHLKTPQKTIFLSDLFVHTFICNPYLHTLNSHTWYTNMCWSVSSLSIKSNQLISYSWSKCASVSITHSCIQHTLSKMFIIIQSSILFPKIIILYLMMSQLQIPIKL